MLTEHSKYKKVMHPARNATLKKYLIIVAIIDFLKRENCSRA